MDLDSIKTLPELDEYMRTEEAVKKFRKWGEELRRCGMKTASARNLAEAVWALCDRVRMGEINGRKTDLYELDLLIDTINYFIARQDNQKQVATLTELRKALEKYFDLVKEEPEKMAGRMAWLKDCFKAFYASHYAYKEPGGGDNA